METGKKFAHLFPPSSFSAIMSIEILSLAFYHLRLMFLSQFLLYFGFILYLILFAGFTLRIIEIRFKTELLNLTQILLLFTFSAGSIVLGTRLFYSHLKILSPFFMILGALSLILLLVIFYRTEENGKSIGVNERTVYFFPFIVFLSLSILIETIYGSMSSANIFTVPVSFILITAGEAGMWFLILDRFINSREFFWHTQSLNGLSFIYFGITSLGSISIIEFIVNAMNHNSFLFSFFLYIAYAQLIITTIMSIFILYFYALKLRRRHFEMKYSSSMWGSVFPSGVSAMGYWLFFHFSHNIFAYYISLIYGTAGLTFFIGIIFLLSLSLFRPITNSAH